MEQEQYRTSPRAHWLAYNEGFYFVTACCRNHRHYFGEIKNNVMKYTDVGLFLFNELSNPSIHHSNIQVPVYTVMPNHFHAMIYVDPPTHRPLLPETVEERCLPGYVNAARRVPTTGRNIPLLSAYISSLKSAVSKFAHSVNPDFEWLPRYHDHMIRNGRDAARIADYIENNVYRWNKDCFNL